MVGPIVACSATEVDVPVRFPFDTDDMGQTMSVTEDSAERGLVKKKDEADPETYATLGQACCQDDEAGDIADEGRGHRG